LLVAFLPHVDQDDHVRLANPKPCCTLSLIVAMATTLLACGSGSGGISALPMPPGPAVNGPPWTEFGGNAQHTATAAIASQTLGRIVAMSNPQGRGYLLGLSSATLVPLMRAPLVDPATGTPALISGDSTASPTVGPDGDVYFGVLEANFPAHNARGWLLHFDSALAQTRIPGAFGWDDSASIVPTAAVPSYAGAATYLLAVKYNNYAGAGTGDGQNRMAVLDPSRSQIDPISGIATMAEVMTVLAPTPDPGHPGGVKEWCVNTAVVDAQTRSILVNNAVLFAVGR
jgi:hypothetical protein